MYNLTNQPHVYISNCVKKVKMYMGASGNFALIVSSKISKYEIFLKMFNNFESEYKYFHIFNSETIRVFDYNQHLM
jgi:hypothetical protein